MSNKQTIGVIFGGRSGEYEVSIHSATAIVQQFDHAQYEVIPIAIAKDGRWFGPIAEDDVATFRPENYQQQEVTIAPKPGGALLRVADGTVVAILDAVFPIIHGTYGEDGVLQGLFELANIPYVGAGVAGSAVGMDKIFMRKILAYHQIPQVRFTMALRSDFEECPEAVLDHIEQTLPYPIFVKPANAGSSVGITKAGNRLALAAGLQQAARYDRRILLEEGLDVREIEVAVLGNDAPMASVPGEIIASNEFYDYQAKYIDNQSVAQIPAQVAAETAEQIKVWAREVYVALDCAGLARVDFFIDKKDNQIYLNEINTLPGFTEISMYAKLWEASGLPMPQLLSRLVELAIAKQQDKQRNVIDF